MKVKYINYHKGDFLTLNKTYPVHNNKIYHDAYKNKSEYYILNNVPFLKFYNIDNFEVVEN